MAAIVNIIFVDDGGGGVGADERCPMPHAAEGRPADDVVTLVVGFSPIACSPARPLPILHAVVFVVVVVFVVDVVVVEQALPVVFPPPTSPPPPPPPPVLSSSAIERQRESQRKP